jgi:organic radical activating enzyme
MDEVNTKTFCGAPWFGIRTQSNGSFAPCCEFTPALSEYKGKKDYTVDANTIEDWANSDYIKYLRQELGAGNNIAECNKCWKKEKNNIISLRQQINDTLTDNHGNKIQNTWINSFLKKKDKKTILLIADIKIGNLCNYSCVMCNPYDSSIIFTKWQKEKQNIFVKEEIKKNKQYFNEIKNKNKKKYSHNILLEILKHPIKHLKFLGGEPLLEKKLLTILSNIDNEKKKNISLHFVSNGSIDITEIIKKYNLNFKSVSASISLEGIEDMQVWARKGSNWQTVKKNILLAKKKGVQVSIHYTIQLSTIFRLNNLLNWCSKEKLPITFGYVDNPVYLSIENLSEDLKKNIIDNLSTNKLSLTKGINSYYHENETSVENLVTFLLEKFKNKNKNQIDKFYKFIEWYEKDSQLKLKNIVPELYK